MRFRKLVALTGLSLSALSLIGCGGSESDTTLTANTLSVSVQPEKGPFQRVGKVEAWGLKAGAAPTKLSLQSDTNINFTNGRAELIFSDRNQVTGQDKVVFQFLESEFSLDGDFTLGQAAAGTKKMTEPFMASILPSAISSTVQNYTAPKADLIDHLALAASLGQEGILGADASFRTSQIVTSVTGLTNKVSNLVTSLAQSYAGTSAQTISQADRIKANAHLVAQLIQATVDVAADAITANQTALGLRLGSLTKQMATTSNLSAVLTTGAGFLKPLPENLQNSFVNTLTAKLQSQLDSTITSALANIPFANITLPNLNSFLGSQTASNTGSNTNSGNSTSSQTPVSGALSSGDTPVSESDASAMASLVGKRFEWAVSEVNPNQRAVYHFFPDSRLVLSSTNNANNNNISVYFGLWEVHGGQLITYPTHRIPGQFEFNGSASFTAITTQSTTVVTRTTYTLTNNQLVLNLPENSQTYTLDTSCGTDLTQLKIWPRATRADSAIQGTDVTCHQASSFPHPIIPNGGFTEQLVGNLVFETSHVLNSQNFTEAIAFTDDRRWVQAYSAGGNSFLKYGIWRVFHGHLLQTLIGDRGPLGASIGVQRPQEAEYYSDSLVENSTTFISFRTANPSGSVIPKLGPTMVESFIPKTDGVSQRIKGRTSCAEGTLRFRSLNNEHCLPISQTLNSTAGFTASSAN